MTYICDECGRPNSDRELDLALEDVDYLERILIAIADFPKDPSNHDFTKDEIIERMQRMAVCAVRRKW